MSEGFDEGRILDVVASNNYSVGSLLAPEYDAHPLDPSRLNAPIVHDVTVDDVNPSKVARPAATSIKPSKAAPKKRAGKTTKPEIKKRAPLPKEKPSEKTSVSSENLSDGEDAEDVAGGGDTPLSNPVATPVKKVAAKSKKGKQPEPEDGVTPASTATSGKKRSANVDGNGETPTKKPKAKEEGTTARFDPTLLSKLDEDDQILFKMREEGKTWTEIKNTLAAKKGKKMGNSTLPNRYTRLSIDLIEWKETDIRAMLTADEESKKDIDRAIKKAEAEKWAIIASKMQELGTCRFPPAAIEKKFKQVAMEGFTLSPVQKDAGGSQMHDGGFEADHNEEMTDEEGA
ncbi:MAG: hypothetical protein M1818_004271 [Claussenomyces sp. TS43310]|nr:MAG: hypothetical protein M1818_004271 [Claussenomyces sp. TS43310]